MFADQFQKIWHTWKIYCINAKWKQTNYEQWKTKQTLRSCKCKCSETTDEQNQKLRKKFNPNLGGGEGGGR